MKAKPTCLLVAATFTLCTVANSQTVDTSTGTVLDSNAAPSVASAPQSSSSKLTVALLPMSEGGKTKGNLTFTAAGDAVNASGRVEGLEPKARYRISVDPAVHHPAMDAEAPTAVAPPPSQAGAPAAGQPAAGAPSAGAPVAGKPNGEDRPGTGGSGSSGTPVTGSREPVHSNTESSASGGLGILGTVIADSAGNANVSLTLRQVTLSEGPAGLAGRTVVVSPMPGDQSPNPTPVAAGVIMMAKGDRNVGADVPASE